MGRFVDRHSELDEFRGEASIRVGGARADDAVGLERREDGFPLALAGAQAG